MAKRIIQMYDKYHSTTKVYPKIIKESLEKDVTDYIEGQVEANPSLAGTEASLTGLQVGDTKYKVEQPINVEANPILAGTESDLSSIEIGDTKYKIGGGKILYRNRVDIGAASWTYHAEAKTGHITLDLICETELKNITDFISYINSLDDYKSMFGVITSAQYTTYPLYIRGIKKASSSGKLNVKCRGMELGNSNNFEFENVDFQNAASFDILSTQL